MKMFGMSKKIANMNQLSQIKQLAIKSMAIMIVGVLILQALVINNVGGIDTLAANEFDKKAVWISYLDYTNLKDKSLNEFRSEFQNMCNKVSLDGMNTVIVQVRAFADSIYPSAYYPWSQYITSNNNGVGYDPLKNMVEIAHNSGLKFEAWFNPYRVSTSTKNTDKIKASGWLNGKEDYVIEYVSGEQTCLILDPSKAEARELIKVGIKEVLYNYDVDGIHFDDYFYKREIFFDTTKEERMENVNTLIREVYSLIKERKPNVTFGISPNGDIAGCENSGANVSKWITEKGYVDYVMPQIYWSNSYGADGSIQRFSAVLNQWKSYYNGNTKIYVGLALYKCGQELANDVGWKNRNDNLYEQLTELKLNGISGFALFRYAHLLEGSTQDEMNNVKSFLNDYMAISDTLFYQVYTSNNGWSKQTLSGNTATFGENTQKIEAIRMGIDNPSVSGDIEYATYLNNTKWTNWSKSYAISGELNDKKRVEAIKIRLTGELANKYDVVYRTFVRDIGWLEWTMNGSISGTTGMSKSVDAIQIKLVKKNEYSINSDLSSNIEAYNLFGVKAHVQNYGWRNINYVSGGVAGTLGESRRLEAIQFNKIKDDIDGNIEYRTHVQNKGWLDWVVDGEVSGTNKQSLRIEALQIRLTGKIAEEYDIYYRVHVQNKGWLGWTKNGEIAGTTGMSLRVEALQFVCVKKGEKAPASTATPNILLRKE